MLCTGMGIICFHILGQDLVQSLTHYLCDFIVERAFKAIDCHGNKHDNEKTVSGGTSASLHHQAADFGGHVSQFANAM